MDKLTAASVTNQQMRCAPEGAGTSTTSGVTIYENAQTVNQNAPPPPSYEQATGTVTTTTTTRNVTYNQTQWMPPNEPHRTATQYVAFATPASSSTTTYSYAPVQPPIHIHQQPQSGVMQAPVVILQQPLLPLGPEPVYLTCPACHVQKLTRIEYQPSSRTHLMAALLCLFGLWCCVCLPYCAGSCMNCQHYCGNCGKFLGTYGNSL